MQRFLALLALSFLLLHSAHAQIPKTISYQGILTEANGAPASGLKTLTFRLHDTATAGNVVWCEQQDVILGTGGVFSVLLGLGSPVSGCANANLGSVIFDKPFWLAIIVDGAEQPRIPLSAVPYSLNRHSSLDASDGDPRNSVYVDGTGKMGIGTTNPQRHLHVVGSPEVAIFQGPNGLIDIDGGGTRITGSNGLNFRGQESGETRMTLTPDGNLGIGTTNPGAKLEVNGTVRATALSGGFDTSASDYIRLGDCQICWGQGAVAVPASTNTTIVNVSFPAGCVFVNSTYRLTATMTSNYGNAHGYVSLIESKNTSSANIRITRDQGSALNAGGSGVIDYIVIGRWR